MGGRDEKFYPLYRITNNQTNESWEARGWQSILKLVGLSKQTPKAQMAKSQKWKVETLDPGENWNEREYRRLLYAKSKPKYKEYEAKKLAADPLYERRKKARLRKWKNIDGTQFTAEQHEEMLSQDCSICGSHEHIVVDHCHETYIVRGPLCRKCNLGLGHANDSVEVLQEMVYYLQNHKILVENNKNAK